MVELVICFPFSNILWLQKTGSVPWPQSHIYIYKLIFNTKYLAFTDQVCPMHGVSLEALSSCAPFKMLAVTKEDPLVINPFTPLH